jgi:hypothetical protein
LSCFAPNLTHHCDDFFMWSGNHKFYIQFSRLLRLQSFRITLYIEEFARKDLLMQKLLEKMDVYIKDKDIKNDQIRNLEKETLHLRKSLVR